jgi:probable O-glycosylation ligase (exosortase A-associated)
MIISLAFYAVAVIVAVMGLRFPMLPAVLYVWFDLFPIQSVFPGVITGFSLGSVLGVSMLFGALLQGEFRRFRTNSLLLLLLVYLAWITLTTSMAVHETEAWVKWDRPAKAIASVLVLVPLLNSRERIESFLWAIVLPIALLGLRGAVGLVQTGGEGVSGTSSSLTGGPVDRNFVGVRLVAALPIAFYLMSNTALFKPTQVFKTAALSVAGVIFLSIIATYSRGALVGLVALLVCGVVLSRNRVRTTFLLVAVSLLILPLAPESWWDRMGTVKEYQSEESAAGRLVSWRFAWDYAIQHPLTGGGFAIYLSHFNPVGYNVDFHSFVFETMAEHGFVGLGLYIFFVVTAFRSLRWAARNACDGDAKWVRPLSLALAVSLIGMYASGLFVNFATQTVVFYLMAVVISVRMVVSDGIRGLHALGPKVIGQRHDFA